LWVEAFGATPGNLLKEMVGLGGLLKRTCTDFSRLRGGGERESEESERAVDIAILDSYHREYEG
jgi:hypothetical protein